MDGVRDLVADRAKPPGGPRSFRAAPGTGHRYPPWQICRNVTIAGRRTSVRLEDVFWDCLREICRREAIGLSQLCTLIDGRRGKAGLTPSLRVFVVGYFREATPPGAPAAEGRPAPLASALDALA